MSDTRDMTEPEPDYLDPASYLTLKVTCGYDVVTIGAGTLVDGAGVGTTTVVGVIGAGVSGVGVCTTVVVAGGLLTITRLENMSAVVPSGPVTIKSTGYSPG